MVLAWFLPIYYNDVAFGKERDACDDFFRADEKAGLSGEGGVSFSLCQEGRYAPDADFPHNGMPVPRKCFFSAEIGREAEVLMPMDLVRIDQDGGSLIKVILWDEVVWEMELLRVLDTADFHRRTIGYQESHWTPLNHSWKGVITGKT